MENPGDRILNPKTNRYVLKSGKIGKKLLQNTSVTSRNLNRTQVQTTAVATPKDKQNDKIFGLESTKYRWIDSNYKYNGYWCIKLTPGLFLYRGNKVFSNLTNQATYFAPWHGTSNSYLPKGKDGYFSVYQIKHAKNLNLMDLSKLENLNKLLSTYFHDKPIYEMIKNVTIGKIIEAKISVNPNVNDAKKFKTLETPTQPYQLKYPIRTSIIKDDYKFSNWLCEQGFDGYAAEDMNFTKNFLTNKKTFPAEVMLCNPKNDVVFLKGFPTRKFTKMSLMEKAIGENYLNKRI